MECECSGAVRLYVSGAGASKLPLWGLGGEEEGTAAAAPPTAAAATTDVHTEDGTVSNAATAAQSNGVFKSKLATIDIVKKERYFLLYYCAFVVFC